MRFFAEKQSWWSLVPTIAFKQERMFCSEMSCELAVMWGPFVAGVQFIR